MHPEQWPRVESIFQNALRIPLTSQDSFVRSSCGQDQYLYAEVTSLLRSHEAESLLDHGAASIAARWLLATTYELRAGNRIGPYEISDVRSAEAEWVRSIGPRTRASIETSR